MTKSPDLLHHQIALSLLPGIGSLTAKNLVAYCGGVAEIFSKKQSFLERIPGIGPEKVRAILAKSTMEKAEKELLFVERNEVQTSFYLDEEYPNRLRHCEDGPVLIYFKGSANLQVSRCVAIIGTRHITENGRLITEQLVRDLQVYDPCIVSGLAYGVDIVAHRSAVKHKLMTIGVTAHGMDRIYPFIHKPVAEQMMLHGGILTEYPSETIPTRDNFPARNRIIAGMADATIVVESAGKGGALITAEFALNYNRDVFAFPGRVNDAFSKGCNRLIHDNKAMLVEHAEQIAEALNWDVEDASIKKKQIKKQLQLFTEFTSEEKVLLEKLQQNSPMSLDALALQTGFSVSQVAALLLNLEFQGVLKALPGKMFQLI